MDADLNQLTVETLWGFIRDKQRSVSLIINDHKTSGQFLDLYDSDTHLTK